MLHGEAQELTEEQKNQALMNIGAAPMAHTHTAGDMNMEVVTEAIEGSNALITSGGVHEALSSVSVDGYVPIDGCAMEGALIAKTNPDITVAQMLNIRAGVDDLVAGESA